MKHIFKKRHHHSNRSNNEVPAIAQQSSSSLAAAAVVPAPSQSSSSSSSADVSDNRTTSSSVIDPGASPSISSTSSNTASSAATASAPSLPTRQQQDYYASEEDFQVQLAIALSVSSSSAKESGHLLNSGADHHQIQGRVDSDAAADWQSRQYWDYGVIEYEERIMDGFYDVYNLSTDPSTRGRMPSLADIEANPSGADFEVVIVNRKFDTALEELMQIALCYAEDCPRTEISVLVQRLAELVTDQMGGPVKDANFVLARWMERSTELRTSLHTAVLPIGSLRIGLSRHRALLFKVLADVVKMPCRLVKGSHYTGIEDDAVNVIKLPNESEFLVDLMAAPGTLIPADAQSGKESNPPKSDTMSNLQASSDLVAAGSKQNFPAGQYFQGDSKFFLGRGSEMPDNLPTFYGASTSSGLSEFNNKVRTVNQKEPSQALAIGSLHKGVRGPNIVDKGTRMNLNMVPYNDNNPDDPKNLFADLNPFQIKASGKPYLKGNITGRRIDELQQPNKNLIAGRPPVPLMWRNSHANNEVPQTKKYDNESRFTKNSHQAVDPSASSIPYTSTSASEKVFADISKLQNMSHQAREVTNNASALASSETSLNHSPSQNNWIMDLRRSPLKDCGVLQNDEFKVAIEPGDKVNGWEGSRNNKIDGILHSSSISLDPVSPCSSVNSEAPHVDAVIDDVSECEIPWEDLEIGERIGLGSYGEVYRADWNGTEVAVKKFLDQDFLGAALEEFRREVRIMQRLRHPNVVLFMGAVTRPPNLSIVTEFLPRGSLYRIIHRPQCQIDEKQRIKMALDVAKGMNCLHTSIPTIVHRDLKSPNLLVDNNWNVKVGDFGLSRLKHNTFLSSKSTAGTPEWMAPEVLRNEPSNEKCDVYSFGIILWELATLKLPWSGMNPMQVVGAVGFQNRRLDIPKEVDPLVARIIWECWQTDPNLRPSFAQLAVALKPLQRLVVPSYVDQPNSLLPQEVSFTP